MIYKTNTNQIHSVKEELAGEVITMVCGVSKVYTGRFILCMPAAIKFSILQNIAVSFDDFTSGISNDQPVKCSFSV